MHCLLRCLPVAQQLLRPPVSSALAGGLPFQQHRSVHWRGSGYLGTGSVGDQAGQEEEPRRAGENGDVLRNCASAACADKTKPSPTSSRRFLVTGACGQIGSELVSGPGRALGREDVERTLAACLHRFLPARIRAGTGIQPRQGPSTYSNHHHHHLCVFLHNPEPFAAHVQHVFARTCIHTRMHADAPSHAPATPLRPRRSPS